MRNSSDTAFSDLEIFSLMLIKDIKKYGTEKGDGDGDQIKEKKTVKIKFVDPFKNISKKSYQCPYCDHKTEAATVKSLQFHVRKKHPGSPQVKESTFAADEEQKNEIICLLKKKDGSTCSKKFSPDQIIRHLVTKKSHQQAHVQPQGQDFKGWRIKRIDEREEVEIVWGLPSASNPPSDEEIELEIPAERSEEIPTISKKRKTQNKQEQEDSDSKRRKAEVYVPGHDGVLIPLGHVLPVPLTDAGAASVGKDDAVAEPVPLVGGPDLLNAGGDVEGALGLEALGKGLLHQRGDPAHVLVPKESSPSPSHTVINPEQNSSAGLGKENEEGIDHDGVGHKIFQEQTNQILILPSSFQENQEGDVDPNDFLQDGNLMGLSFEMDTNSNSVFPNFCPNTDTAALQTVHASPQIVKPAEGNDRLLSGLESDHLKESGLFTSPSPLLSSVADMDEDNLMNKKENLDNEENILEEGQVDQVEMIINSSILNQMECQEACIADFDTAQTEKKVEKEDYDSLNEVLTSQESILEDLETVSAPTKVIDLFYHEDLNRRVKVKVQNPTMKRGEQFWCDENFSQKLDQKSSNAEKIGDENQGDFNERNLQDLEEDSDDDSDMEDQEVDSDFDENLDSDPLIFRKRQESRKVRFRNRDSDERIEDLSAKKGNKEFISEFISWLEAKTSLKTANKKCSTLNLSKGHLYEYSDSFLFYNTSLDPSFNLGKLVDFKNKDNYLSIKSPVAWISAAAGTDKTSNPARQKEQLKLSKRVRSFISYKLNSTAFDGNDVILTLVVNNQLQAIDKEIADNKMFQKLTVLYEKETARTKKMKMIANPDGDELQYDCVKRWHKSNEAKELEKKIREICTKALTNEALKAMNFNKVANYSRFNLAISDKNRPSSYKFTEGDYRSKVPIWLPPDDKYLWSLETLPSGWQMFSDPGDGTPPTCFLLRLDGSQSEIKMQAKTDIIVDMKSYEFLELYSDLKVLLFGKKIPSSRSFFVNHKGKPLSRIQRSKGSLVETFGNVVGIPDFRMTNIRAALEGKIQGGKEADHTKDINNHTKSVAVGSYDNAASMRRSLYISSVAADESSESVDVDKVKSNYNLRKKKGLEEHEKMKDEAKQYLQEKKRKKKIVNLSPSPLTRSDLPFLESLFTAEDYEGKKDII